MKGGAYFCSSDMISLIKQFLSKTLGIKKYLTVISRAYFFLYRLGLLKNKYPENYLVQNLVNPGDYVIDLGANLGYYTIPISRIIGKNGKIWAVEPIPIFNEVLTTNKSLSPYPENIVQLPYALGDKDGDVITMQVPVRNGVIRHGLSTVEVENGKKSQETSYLTYQVTSYNPATLFQDISRVDFIKCDVEGYETHIIPHIKELIQTFLPWIQIEIVPKENRFTIHKALKPLGYEVYGLTYPTLKKGEKALEQVAGDFYFIPENSSEKFEKKIGLVIE